MSLRMSIMSINPCGEPLQVTLLRTFIGQGHEAMLKQLVRPRFPKLGVTAAHSAYLQMQGTKWLES